MRVSVVMPVLNEAAHIAGVLRGLFQQDWHGPLEVVIVDGGSDDGTVSIIEKVAQEAPPHVSFRLLHNPRRHIPISLNLACQNSSGEVIVRLDGHTYPPREYISRLMKALQEINFQGIVGGRCEIVPARDSMIAQAIAVAVSHPVGIGNAAYRVHRGGGEGLITVDTVPFGAFAKTLWMELGGYDERFLASEDYDFAWRARKRGYQVYMDPHLVCRYIPRDTFGRLWQQYFRYGYWVSHLLLKHRAVPTLRKLAPLALLTSVCVAFLMKPWIGWSILGTYVLVLGAIATVEAFQTQRTVGFALLLLLAFITLHWSYAAGNLVGFLAAFYKRFASS